MFTDGREIKFVLRIMRLYQVVSDFMSKREVPEVILVPSIEKGCS